MAGRATQFSVPIPYWPRRRGLFWWSDGLRDDLRRDFDAAAEHGVRQLEIALPWPEFQPMADRISVDAMRRLELLFEEAAEYGLSARPVLFPVRIGRLIVLPHWALHPLELGEREIYSSGGFTRLAPLNLYSDSQMVAAQSLLVREVVGEFRGHPAVLDWCLGKGMATVGTPRAAEEFGEWLDLLVAATALGGSRPDGLWTSISARDVVRSASFDPAIPASLDVSLAVQPLWAPAWAHGAGVLWPAFLAGYTTALAGRPVTLALEAAWTPETVVDGGVQQRAVEHVLAAGGAGAVPPPLFDLEEGVTRTDPYRRGAYDTAIGLLRVDGSPRDAFAFWRDLQLDPPGVRGVPGDFPVPDPEHRAAAPEDVAYASFEAFVR
jgi:hypothetical protein